MDSNGGNYRNYRAQEQQQSRKNSGNGSSGGVNSMKREKNLGFRNYPLLSEEDEEDGVKIEDDRRNRYHLYSGKYRKSAVKSNPETLHPNPVRHSRVLDEKPINVFNPFEHGNEPGKGFLGSKCRDRYACQMFEKMPQRNETLHPNPVRSSRVLAEKPINVFNPFEEHGVEMCKGLVGSRCRDRYACNMFEKMPQRNEVVEYKKNNVGYSYCNYDYDVEKAMDEVESKRRILEEFRRVYRRLEGVKVPKQSVRTDMLAWKEIERVYGAVLKPVKTIGEVPGVEVGDAFDLRLELMIMGIHFQSIHGIDYMDVYPNRTLLATSVVATDGYEDNLVEPDVVWYTGVGGGGGNFGTNKVKDQVLKGGNLALKNSMKEREPVRVVRGVKRGRSNKPVFVYDGLYKVVDCSEIGGPGGCKQFQFKLVRCPGQKHIVWAQYKC